MSSSFPRSTQRWLWLCGGTLLVLRVVYAWTLRVNSDEPQHLHVVWAWTQGLLPYRDVFDNHAPLFQLLSAPLFALIGERAQIIPLMRLATIPWYALALWCTYRIGRALYDRDTGIWSALLTAIAPAFFILSAQFRTDVAWAPLWLATMMIAVEGRPTPRRAFGVGFFAGAACSVSLKSLLLLATLGAASFMVLALQRSLARRLPVREIVATSGAVIAGFAVLPLAIAFGFWRAGAWDAFVYGVFVHNVVPGLGTWDHFTWRFALFPLALPVLVWSARELMRRDADPDRGAKRAFMWLAAMCYATALMSYWPLVTRQDLLPFRPLLAVFVVALLRSLPLPQRLRAPVPFALLLLAAVELAQLLTERPPWRDEAHGYVQELSDVRRLTDANDYVMDAKGEAIFRRRPFYYALETVTLKRIELGLIPDTVAASLASTSTAVVIDNELERMPPAARAFIEQNYLPVYGRIRVAGKMLPDVAVGAPRGFEVAVSLEYALRDAAGPFEGLLDGTPYNGPRRLDAGSHTLTRTRGTGAVVVLWARAAERGYLPRVPDAPR